VSLPVWIAVSLLGGTGALGRFLSGATLLGLLVGLGFTGNRLLLAGTATLGSYTTFSMWMLETLSSATG
jgi:fluoride exporter